MVFFDAGSIPALANPGVVSRQILSPDTAPDARVTITEVHLEPGASQPRHVHAAAEQCWYALRGEGTLLLADGAEHPFRPGDAVRFAPGDVHGLFNGGTGEFVYLSVTVPPVSFAAAYKTRA